MNTRLFVRSISVASVAAVLAWGNAAVADSDSSKPHSASLGAAIDDTAITGKVKAKFMDDTRLRHADISVTTANGVVTLTGTAPTTDAKDTAGELARNVEGVSSVNNQVQAPSANAPSAADQVESTTKHAAKETKRVVSDSWITTKVKASLLADSVVKGFKIKVKTRHHVVTLSGTVDTQASIDHAAELAQQIEGVKRVDTSRLKTGSN